MESSNFDLSAHRVEAGDLHDVYYIPEFFTEEEESYLIRQINNAPRPKWKTLGNRRLQVWGGDITSSKKLITQPLPSFLNKYPDLIGRLEKTGAFANSKNGKPNHVIVNEYLPRQGIMPHEDGPSYHPVVATISLGSHTVFHYYRYNSAGPDKQSEEGLADSNLNLKNAQPSEGGRTIDMARPVLSLLLEPRSLVITAGALYSDHLHGISDFAKDVLLPARVRVSSGGDSDEREKEQGGVVRVANWHMLSDKGFRDAAQNGGTLERRTRISLTCRDVEQVIDIKSLR